MDVIMDVGLDYFSMASNVKDCTIKEKIDRYTSFYEKLPDPKTEVRNSYLFVAIIGELALEDGDYDLAEKWGVIGLQYKGIHGLLGEQEFFLGQVYFAKGEIEKAREYFVKVRKNSGWRLFKDENPEYRKLVEEKK